MKVALVVLLILLVLLLGLPLAMGMTGPGFCPDCESHGPPCPAGVCSGVVVLFALLAVGLAESYHLGASRFRGLLLAFSLDRPPRFA
jgi:hypothetical protein